MTHPLKRVLALNLPLASLRGVGPAREAAFARKGLRSVFDLLFFMPRRYEDRTQILPIGEAGGEGPVLVGGRVISGREERIPKSGKRLYRITIRDGTNLLDLVWFRYKRPHLTRLARPGLELLAYGRVKRFGFRSQMAHPEVTLSRAEDFTREGPGFLPVYPAVSGLSNKVLRSIVGEALSRYGSDLTDFVPREIIERQALPGLAEAIQCVHRPPRNLPANLLNQWATPYQRRLVFDRFFLVMLELLRRKRIREHLEAPRFTVPGDLLDRLEANLSFRLTRAQIGAIQEILRDLGRGRPMNRLVQGDVGCGKTVVALAAAWAAALNGFQTAVMAPTQVLAQQHHAFFSELGKKMGFRSLLLTGAMGRAQRLDAYQDIHKGTYQVVIGTQALIQDAVGFRRLGLIIIDEQHRFGVKQRSLLDRKGRGAHLLIMSATPIPRTLAMTLYADMELTRMREFPRGHRPVETYLVDAAQKKIVYQVIKEKMALGQQAIVICPLIEGTEETDVKNVRDMTRKLRKIYSPPHRVGWIHGNMDPLHKERVMEEFRAGRIHLLVGTTVIEVGVHVPSATVMVVEGPERFGLAQLHQLRGRVGRGKDRGLCFLMVGGDVSEDQRARLELLSRSSDGFEIAERDLEMRGHGEWSGTKQSGAGELHFSEILREPRLLEAAKREAEDLLRKDPGLDFRENRYLRLILESRCARPLEF